MRDDKKNTYNMRSIKKAAGVEWYKGGREDRYKGEKKVERGTRKANFI